MTIKGLAAKTEAEPQKTGQPRSPSRFVSCRLVSNFHARPFGNAASLTQTDGNTPLPTSLGQRNHEQGNRQVTFDPLCVGLV